MNINQKYCLWINNLLMYSQGLLKYLVYNYSSVYVNGKVFIKNIHSVRANTIVQGHNLPQGYCFIMILLQHKKIRFVRHKYSLCSSKA